MYEEIMLFSSISCDAHLGLCRNLEKMFGHGSLAAVPLVVLLKLHSKICKNDGANFSSAAGASLILSLCVFVLFT